MIHVYKEGKSKKPVFLLLHGTGGNERDLIPLANLIDPEATLLGVRGNVTENGMPRFFRRLAEGVFDEEDLIQRTEELQAFLSEAAEKYSFDRENILAIGFSNGANIAGSLLFHYEKALKGAMLLHPMVPRRGIDLPNLKYTPVFIGAGKQDPLVPQSETLELADLLKNAGASVDLHWENGGHQLTHSELQAAKAWYEKVK
ncbi:phospholipase/carboxylesterase [Pullulanibacillus pueri]|uniref:Phospholipase/carboxylesterase n=1 Tax=Pullulanibacillus pueri TaxID=1437324 RepID=A0A8J2ZTX2_9BACL|nr:alpha/beta hydrolase [Pullulanibacillus pueri]MBM7681081.1 phospholipase/carboxylesterase [Pullulanibacillus pueri]GGH76973.1 phospholipase/carboxylesterase [Pullulanibacillus pueri]